MPSVKRSNTAIEVTSTPKRQKKAPETVAVKSENSPDVANNVPNGIEGGTVQPKDDEIADLKAQIEELHTFIMHEGLMTSKIPTICNGNRPLSVAVFNVCLETTPSINDGLNCFQMQQSCSINKFGHR